MLRDPAAQLDSMVSMCMAFFSPLGQEVGLALSRATSMVVGSLATMPEFGAGRILSAGATAITVALVGPRSVLKK